MIKAQDQAIHSLVADMDSGKLLMPEFQRSYVWKSDQVRNLFDSLYHKYPSGQLLIWETDDIPTTRTASIQGIGFGERRPQLLLDGQQRLTSLSSIMLGKPLVVKGSPKPIDIVFNVFTEKFEVASPRQRGQSGWISLTKFFTHGAMSVFAGLTLDDTAPDEKQQVFDRLTRLENIKTYNYRVNVLEQLSYNEVTDIFVRVNSAGTPLNKGDLALAQVSSRWQGVTVELEHYLKVLEDRGFDVDNGFLLRLVLVILTNQSAFSLFFRGERQNTTVSDLQDAWKRVKRAFDQAANFVIHNCHIDRPKMLPAKNLLIPLVAYFDRYGRDVTPAQARALQRWVYLALIWARYTGPTETLLDQDLSALTKPEPIQAMIQNLEDRVGHRPVTERELQTEYTKSPYTVMLYVLARRAQAQDWFNGVVLGGDQPIEFHHIFPKAYLQKHNYDLRKHRSLIDQLANIAFLSDKANNRISKSAPLDYLEEIDESRLKAQYIPLDRSLWRAERFEDFLRERRTLLSEAVNNLLASLSEAREPAAWPPDSSDTFLEVRVDAVEKQLRELIEECLIADQGDYAWEHAVPSDIRRSVRFRIDQAVAKNPFEAGNYDPLSSKLALCQFSDYPKIMLANWALFQDVFASQAHFSQHINSVTEARNALKHGREINRTDRHLAQAGLNWIEDVLRSDSLRASEQEDVAEESLANA